MSTTSAASQEDDQTKTTPKPTVTADLHPHGHHKPTKTDAAATTLVTVTFDCLKPLPAGVDPQAWANACNPVWATMQSLQPTSSESSTGVVAGSTTSTSTPGAASGSNNSSSTTAMAAGIAGGVVGAAVLIAGIVYYVRKKRNNGTKRSLGKHGRPGRRDSSDSDRTSDSGDDSDDEKGSESGSNRGSVQSDAEASDVDDRASMEGSERSVRNSEDSGPPRSPSIADVSEGRQSMDSVGGGSDGGGSDVVLKSELGDVVMPLPEHFVKPNRDSTASFVSGVAHPKSSYQPYRPGSVVTSPYDAGGSRDTLEESSPPPSKVQHFSIASRSNAYESFL